MKGDIRLLHAAFFTHFTDLDQIDKVREILLYGIQAHQRVQLLHKLFEGLFLFFSLYLWSHNCIITGLTFGF